MLKQGPTEQRIIKQCMRARKPFPKAIQEAPHLAFGLELYWDAFWDLSTCRATGFGVGPIPWSAMRDYAVTFELDEEQQEDLYYLVRVMDNTFLDHHSEKKES